MRRLLMTVALGITVVYNVSSGEGIVYENTSPFNGLVLFYGGEPCKLIYESGVSYIDCKKVWQKINDTAQSAIRSIILPGRQE